MKIRKIVPHLIYSIIAILIAFSIAYGGATFARLKVWSTGESLTASQLNAEFNNILDGLDPTGIDDESANDAAAQTTSDPYPSSSLSKATSLETEIQQLRYLIAQITGETYWYIDSDTDMAALYTFLASFDLTDHGILVGSGTGAVTPLAAATNGQLPIGSTGADPVPATVTGTANQITITNGAGSITISIPDTAAITFSNAGLHLLDSNATHDLIIKPGSNLAADRILTITTGDAARTLTLDADLTASHVIKGDGTAGRILRCIHFMIDDGTNATTLKCSSVTRFNGDILSSTDNIGKGATTGHFTLDAGGTWLKIEAAGLTGNAVFAFPIIATNISATDLTVFGYIDDNDIKLGLKNSTTGVVQDMTTLVDTGLIEIDILYFTDA